MQSGDPMTYDEFASDLPPKWTLEFTSAEECEAALRREDVEQPMRQLGGGPYRSCLAVRNAQRGDLFADRYNTALSMTLNTKPGRVGILIPRTATGRSADEVATACRGPARDFFWHPRALQWIVS